MKRAIAAFLTFVLIFALFPAKTAVNAAKLGDDPFYCVNFMDPEEDIPNVYYMPFFWVAPINEDTQWPYTSCYGANDDETLAEVLKNDFKSRPKGARYFQLCLVQTAFYSLPENVVYHDRAVKMTKEWVDSFLKMFKEMGGEIDGIIVDMEYIESHSYYLYDYYAGTRGKAENKYIYQDIVNDPRYETQIRPKLEALGFKFYEDVGGEKSEIWCINTRDSSTKGHSECSEIWNYVVDLMEIEAVNECVLEPLQKYYPDGTVSDYKVGAQDTWNRAIGTHGGEVIFNTIGAGNVSNWLLYAGNPENAYFGWGTPVYDNPPSYNDAEFKATPFNMFLYDINYFKNMYASTDDGRIDAWVANYEYGVGHSGYPSTFSGTPYYTEALFHVGLMNPEVYLGYIIDNDYINSCKVVSDILLELTRLVGASDRKPLKPQASWNGSYVLSGMYAAGRNIWRITPDTDVVSLRDFKISSNNEDPTFSIDGLTITFPGGKILKDGDIRMAGSCGYWIETAQDVEPVITATDDRYRKNPSLLEDFEDYNNGANFTTSSALPMATWRVDGTAKIRQNGNNKALALSGTTTIENVQLPENISAGDEYAKQQAWEVTVTLPDTLNDDANVQLLKGYSGDRGIKVAEGKVYYDDGQRYQAIDGVRIYAGNTYTYRREFDFRTSGNFTCTYSVYDSAGKLLGEAKNVKIKNTSLPIDTIAISVTDANAEVLVDDYKLYPTGVTTTLALYDAEIGTRMKDLSASRTDDTAYRMTWLNATNEDMVAYIYDALTGNVIQEVKMKAGLDGVATGIVEASAGKAVQLAVKQGKASSGDNNDNVPPVEDPDGTDPSKPTDSTKPTDGTDSTEPTDGTEPTTPSAETPDATQPSTNPEQGGTQATEPSETPDVGGGDKAKLGTGAIVAIIVSAVIFAAAAAVVVILILKKKNMVVPVSEEENAPVENNGEAKNAEEVSEAENTETE